MKKNFKYWVIGNVLTLNMGLVIIAFLMSWEKLVPGFYVNSLMSEETLFIGFVFLAGLVIKLIRQELPFYFYGTIGVLFIILAKPGVEILYFFIVKNFGITIEFFLPLKLVLLIILFSFLGGLIIDIYRHFRIPQNSRLRS